MHEYKAVITAPTCTEKGYTTYTCSCGDAHIGDEVAALGHDYQAVVTEPTCTEGGFTTHTCARCGDSYTSDAAAALGHDFKNGVCTRCGEKETVPPPQVDKTALNEAVAAADEIDKTKYTEDSVKAFEEALKAARDVQTREDVTQDEVRKAAEDLRAAIEALAERFNKFAVNPESQTVGIAQAGCREDAKYLMELLRKEHPPKEILPVEYEPVTGSHVGPGALALFFLSNETVRFEC